MKWGWELLTKGDNKKSQDWHFLQWLQWQHLTLSYKRGNHNIFKQHHRAKELLRNWAFKLTSLASLNYIMPGNAYQISESMNYP